MLVDLPAEDWLMWRRTYGHWGHSPLDQINTTNVGGLRLAWAWTMREGRQETTPLVHDGMMFLVEPCDLVEALDVRDGSRIWEYRRDQVEHPANLACVNHDEQTDAGPRCRGASLGADGVSHGMSVPHTVAGGGAVNLPGCGRPRRVASNPKVGEAGAHSPWKSRGRSLPLVPAVPAARFPQPHSASSSWASIIGNDPCTTRKSCAGERALDDHEGMITHSEYTLAKLELSEQPGPLQSRPVPRRDRESREPVADRGSAHRSARDHASIRSPSRSAADRSR